MIAKMEPDRTAIMTRKEVCEYLRISDTTLRRMLNTKKIKAARIGRNGNYRFMRKHIDQYFNYGRIK